MTGDLTYPGGGVRLHVEGPLRKEMRITPSPEQAHYLLHVMRAKAGDMLSLFNGRDGEWRAEIADVTKRSCTLVCRAQSGPQQAVPDLWLVFAPIKKTPTDYLVQKATELGASLLQPVFTRRTIVTRVNRDRMRANAIEAAEQSGRTDVPEIREPLPLEKLLAQWPADRKLLFCDEAGDALPIAKAFAQKRPSPLAEGGEAQRATGEGDCSWAILTGPEGGFDPAERAVIRARDGAIPVTLGKRILRADTAALAALAIFQSLRGDWD
ncbi:MAG: 16S rRNA (uracil(1498)-N(3))-methyltransferase [Alphaproteobacteria bacterium]|nr:16S rRNA (uracil(1498)-N(3))-methyltransferase [Alphaproteobacteria bacterium]